jgi:ribonuclease T
MKKKYISVDIESSGNTPGKYSMLSLGACIVGNTEVQFYREIKPLNMNYILEAMKISSLGLSFIEEDERFNPKSNKFSPKQVLQTLWERAPSPSQVMSDFASWIIENTKGFRAVEASAPSRFDGMFTSWYFGNFYDEESPLGFSGEDINSMYRGFKKDINAHIKQIKIPFKHSHSALDDAIEQAKKFETFFQYLKT